MSHYTQLNLQAEPKNKPAQNTTPSKQSSPLSAEKKTAAVVGSFMVAAFTAALLLGANGCSKQASQSTTSSASNQPILSHPLTPVSTATLPPTTATPAEPPATTKEHQPGSYKNSALGVSFQYPWQYSLKKGTKANVGPDGEELIPMNFVQPGGIALSTVKIPQGYFPDTNFLTADFNLSVNSKLTADECAQFATSHDSTDAQTAPTKVKIGETEFAQVKTGDKMQPGPAYYHTFQNGACYEIALDMQTDDATEGAKPVNRAKVFRRLESILATVQIDNLDAPEATTTQTASTPAAPTEVPHP